MTDSIPDTYTVDYLSSLEVAHTRQVQTAINRLKRARLCLRLGGAIDDSMLQRTAFASALLVARAFPQVYVDVGEEKSLVRAFPGSLRKALEGAIAAVDPRIKVVDGDLADFDETETFIIGPRSESVKSVAVDVNGWLIHVSSKGTPSLWHTRAAHPATPLAAAAAGVALMVEQVLNPDVTPTTHILNLLDYSSNELPNPQLPQPLDFDCNFFGTGSINSSAILALALDGETKGRLDLVDPDTFERKNFVRYAASMALMEGQPKVAVLGNLLHQASPQTTVNSQQETIQDWAVKLGPVDRVGLSAIAPDTDAARRQAADLLMQNAVVASADGMTARVSHCHFATTICPYCPHMPREAPPHEAAVVADMTGLSFGRARQMLVSVSAAPDAAKLTAGDLARIEEHVDVPRGSYRSRWLGKTLDEFIAHNRDRLYSARRVKFKEGDTTVSFEVPQASVSAFAGAMLVAELIKESSAELHQYSASYNRVEFDLIPGRLQKRTISRPLNCLCDNIDRIKVFGELWPEARETLASRCSKYAETLRPPDA